jgi:hypothetical protein
MKTMNVTAKHGQAAVHLGGRELSNGRWSPACGTQHHNAGGREVTPLRPTDRDVTCKKCLKLTATAKTPEAKRENVRQGWEKFHATMDVMNKRPGSNSSSDSLRDMLTLR